MQMTAIDAIRIPSDASPRIRTAAAELARWIEKLGGTRPTTTAHSDHGRVTAWLDTDGTDLKPEHFRIEVNDGAVVRVTGGDGRGVLYGVQECIDRARRNQAITPLTDGPHFAVRALRMWETPSNKVWFYDRATAHDVEFTNGHISDLRDPPA